jgi:hypothetical protein
VTAEKPDSSEEFRTLTGKSATAGNIVDETRPDSTLPLVTPPAGNPGRLFVLIAANDKEVWVKSSREE